MTLCALGLLLLQPAAATPAADDFAALYERVGRAILSSHWDRNRRRAEIEGRLQAWSERARAAASRQEFADAVNRMIAEFGESHFGFFTDETQTYYLLDGLVRREPARLPHIGAWFARSGDGYTVTMLPHGLPALRAGLRKGDVVVSVDGEPFSPVAALRRHVGKEPVFTVRRGEGTFTARLAVREAPALDMFLQGMRNSFRIIEREGRRIGYVHLWTMANERFRTSFQAIVQGRMQEADAIVVDLRDGFGGRYEGFGDPFFRPAVRVASRTGGVEGGGLGPRFGFADVPLVLVTNEGSRSAKEVFSQIMKTSGRGTLVGSTTAGAVLGTVPMRMAPWAYLSAPVVEITVDGVRIESRGVEPHIRVEREFDADGNDLFLEEALETAVRKIGARAAAGPAP
jgi:carboxyl-terminal processing protease